MAVQSFLRDTTNLFNYSTDERPTTQQEYQEAVKNWVDTIKSLVDCTLWQPDTEYTVGNVLRTPSLPYQLQLTCVTAGTTGSAEPDYTDVEAGDVITDGTAEFRVDTIVSDGDMVDETIKALASSSDVPTGTVFSAATLLSKMVANMNSEDGVRYNFSNPNAWYICLGAKYGGLIIQGGNKGITSADYGIVNVSYPIAFNTILGACGIPVTNTDYTTKTCNLYYGGLQTTGVVFRVLEMPSGGVNASTAYWFAFGY